jgi:hypothetical protein
MEEERTLESAGDFPRALRLFACCVLAVLALSVQGCTPTVRVEVAPINIYAKLDANVRVQLDREVQNLIQQNPNLF